VGLFYDIKAAVINWFSDIRIYPGGFVLFGASSYQIEGKHMRSILNVIRPGDVLLRKYKYYIGSMMIPGYFSHAAIYVGDDSVIHMLGTGIVREDILTFMRCDDITILRADQVAAVYAKIKAVEFLDKGIPYDYDFVSDDSKFYCTELIDDIYDHPVGREKEGKVIIPDDFLSCNFFKVVWTKRSVA